MFMPKYLFIVRKYIFEMGGSCCVFENPCLLYKAIQPFRLLASQPFLSRELLIFHGFSVFPRCKEWHGRFANCFVFRVTFQSPYVKTGSMHLLLNNWLAKSLKLFTLWTFRVVHEDAFLAYTSSTGRFPGIFATSRANRSGNRNYLLFWCEQHGVAEILWNSTFQNKGVPTHTDHRRTAKSICFFPPAPCSTVWGFKGAGSCILFI